MSGNTFVGDHVLLDVGFDAARRQLWCVSSDGVLMSASECAYGEGVTGLDEEAAMSRLAGVQSGDVTETQDCARLWLRWDAISPDGTLFPALDADLTLSPAGETTTELTLTGVYRLPGQAEAGLDPAIVRCFADMTIGCFIARLASALVHPAGSAVPVRRAGQHSPHRTP
jgi:hypothetical protein